MATIQDNSKEVLLVLRCQSGDREAFDELLRTVQTRLWRYISNLTGDRAMAEDILQDVFLIIYRKIGWLNDPKLFRPWIYRIATRETFRVLKKRSRWREETIDDAAFTTLAAPPSKSELDLKILESVSPASRSVLMLHYLEELTLGEIADVLGISVGTAKSRLAYGLKLLRQQMDPQEAK